MSRHPLSLFESAESRILIPCIVREKYSDGTDDIHICFVTTLEREQLCVTGPDGILAKRCTLAMVLPSSSTNQFSLCHLEQLSAEKVNESVWNHRFRVLEIQESTRSSLVAEFGESYTAHLVS